MAGLAAAGLVVMSTHSLAAFPPIINLSDLDGDNGFVIEGTTRYSGESVSGAGDVNGDGIDDIIVGEPGYKYESPGSAVVFGRPSGFRAGVKLSDLDGSDGFLIKGGGEPQYMPSGLGASVSAAGDVNGDGIDDVIIGDFDAAVGESYVVFGRTTGFPAVLNLSDLDGSNGFMIKGIDGDNNYGTSVSAAGDVNGDGIDDIIIGARRGDLIDFAGESYVVFGRTTGFPALLNLSELDGRNGFVINGIDEGDYSGISVSGAGDVNDDGIDDVIIGATGAGPAGEGGFVPGGSYVVFGRTTGFPAVLNLSELDGSNGFVINGIDALDRSGQSVSAAGDVNSDGIDDVIIGAPDDEEAGESYVVFGRTTGFPGALNLSDLDGSNGFVINGIDGDDRSGTSVSAAGDVNDDGIDDVIIGASGATPNGLERAGESYVVFGRTIGFSASLNLAELDGSDGFVINGFDVYDGSGKSVSAAGDVNDDGIDDVIIGATGQSYVVFGRGDAVPKINDYVTFEPDPSTYSFTRDTSGCPSEFVGKFGFEAQLTNVSQSTLSDLHVQVAELSNGNLLLTADGTIGVGGVFPVPEEDGYSDGFLTTGEYADVPFDVCLVNPDPFNFFVDVRGVVENK